jgi:hypothetical protein
MSIGKYLLDDEHFDFKSYTDECSIVFDSLEEVIYLSKTLDYKKIAILLIEIIETADFYIQLDNKDPYSEGYSIIDKTFALNKIIDCEEFKNLEIFMKKYNEDFERKCESLHEKIKNLDIRFEVYNKLIIDDYLHKSIPLLHKLENIRLYLSNHKDDLKPIEEGKTEFNIRLITKNDIICIISSYKYFKHLLYKTLHVINKDYYSVTKEDRKEFIKELYTLYLSVCSHFNSIRKDYLIEDSVINDIISRINYQKTTCKKHIEQESPTAPAASDDVPSRVPILIDPSTASREPATPLGVPIGVGTA